jgi:hypothetical protein
MSLLFRCSNIASGQQIIHNEMIRPLTRAKRTNLARGWGGWKAQLGADTKLHNTDRRPYLGPGL